MVSSHMPIEFFHAFVQRREQVAQTHLFAKDRIQFIPIIRAHARRMPEIIPVFQLIKLSGGLILSMFPGTLRAC
jgi:hypothetical protein